MHGVAVSVIWTDRSCVAGLGGKMIDVTHTDQPSLQSGHPFTLAADHSDQRVAFNFHQPNQANRTRSLGRGTDTFYTEFITHTRFDLFLVRLIKLDASD